MIGQQPIRSSQSPQVQNNHQLSQKQNKIDSLIFQNHHQSKHVLQAQVLEQPANQSFQKQDHKYSHLNTEKEGKFQTSNHNNNITEQEKLINSVTNSIKKTVQKAQQEERQRKRRQEQELYKKAQIQRQKQMQKQKMKQKLKQRMIEHQSDRKGVRIGSSFIDHQEPADRNSLKRKQGLGKIISPDAIPVPETMIPHTKTNKRQKIDARKLSLKALLDACNKKKIGDTNLNYKLLPGLLGNQLDFAKAFLSNQLQQKHFKTCLITPLDHRILSTILTNNFPKQFRMEAQKGKSKKQQEQHNQFNYESNNQQIQQFYNKLYRMEEIIFYKYYLEIEAHFNRKSIKRLRNKYDPIVKKSIKWSQFPHMKKEIDKILKTINESDKTNQILQDMEEERKEAQKRRQDIDSIRSKLKCSSYGLIKPGMTIGKKQRKHHKRSKKQKNQSRSRDRNKNRQRHQKRKEKRRQKEHEQKQGLGKMIMTESGKRRRVQVIDQRNYSSDGRSCSSQSIISSSNSLSGESILDRQSKSESYADSDLRSVRSFSSETPKSLKGPQDEYERSINSSLQSAEEGSYLEDIQPSKSMGESDGDLSLGSNLQNKKNYDRLQEEQRDGDDSDRISGFSDQ